MDGNPVPAPSGQDALEGCILQLLVAEAARTPFGAALAARLKNAAPVRRSLSGKGFFLELEVDQSHVPRGIGRVLPINIDLHDDMPDPLFGGVVYFWDQGEGETDMLEGYTYDRPWPQDVSKVVARVCEPESQQ
jgi:hypothetical protein